MADVTDQSGTSRGEIFSALLREAHGAYAQAIKPRLSAAGFDDIPQFEALALAGLPFVDGAAGDLMRMLGIAEQAGNQIIDSLASRGFLKRRTGPDDRRTMTVEVTERGRAVGIAVSQGMAAVSLYFHKRNIDHARFRQLSGWAGSEHRPRLSLAGTPDPGWAWTPPRTPT